MWKEFEIKMRNFFQAIREKKERKETSDEIFIDMRKKTEKIEKRKYLQKFFFLR